MSTSFPRASYDPSPDDARGSVRESLRLARTGRSGPCLDCALVRAQCRSHHALGLLQRQERGRCWNRRLLCETEPEFGLSSTDVAGDGVAAQGFLRGETYCASPYGHRACCAHKPAAMGTATSTASATW